MGFVLALLLNLSDGVDWNQWRGSLRDGSISVALPETLPEKLEQGWRTEIGFGYGSPVIDGDRLFLLTGDGQQEFISCVNATTGERIWRHAYPVTFKENSYALKFGKGPFSTPLVADGLVYTLGVTGELYALNAADGKVVWHDRFDGDLTGSRLLNCGNSVSPLLLDSRLITHVGDETHGRMTAYHPRTGKKIWTWEDDIAGYASPITATFEGKQQIVSMTQNQIVGIDPDNGKLLWRYNYKVEWRENIITPLVHDNGIIVSGREQGSTLKLDILRKGNAWYTQPVWRNQEQVMYMSSPVRAGNRLYGFSHKNKGQLFILDVATGKPIATGPGRQGENAKLVKTEKHLLALFTSGELVVIPLDKDSLEPSQTYQISESPTWSHPLIFEEHIVIKDKDHLTAWKMR